MGLLLAHLVKSESVSHSLVCSPMDYSPPGSSVHGILQARILKWASMAFSRRSSWPRDCILVSCIAGQTLYHLSQQGSPYSTFVYIRITAGYNINWGPRKRKLFLFLPFGLHFYGVSMSPTLILATLCVQPGSTLTWACPSHRTKFLPRNFLLMLCCRQVVGNCWPFMHG